MHDIQTLIFHSDKNSINHADQTIDSAIEVNSFKSENNCHFNQSSGSIVRSSIVASRVIRLRRKPPTRVQIPAGASTFRITFKSLVTREVSSTSARAEESRIEVSGQLRINSKKIQMGVGCELYGRVLWSSFGWHPIG